MEEFRKLPFHLYKSVTQRSLKLFSDWPSYCSHWSQTLASSCEADWSDMLDAECKHYRATKDSTEISEKRLENQKVYSNGQNHYSKSLRGTTSMRLAFVLVGVSIVPMKHMTKKQGGKRFYQAYTYILLYIIKRSHDRNLNTAEIWRQELMQ